MNPIDQMIETTMAEMNSNLSEEDKKKYKDIFTQIFKEGKTPCEALGFNAEMMEHFYAYGYRLYNLGDYKKALYVFQGINLLNPKDSRFDLALGACYHKLKNNVRAVDHYFLCAKNEPDNPMPHFFMYDCFIQEELWGDAAFCLEEVIRRSGNNPECAELKSRCQLLLEPLKAKLAELNAKMNEKIA